MEINKNHWLNKFYKATYNTTYDEQNFCKWFWEILLGIICLPISWIGYFYDEEFFEKIGTTAFFYIIFIGFMCTTLIVVHSIITDPWIWLIFVILTVIVGLIFITAPKVLDIIKDRIHKPSKTFEIVKTAFKSVKDKYCPIIKWKE
jgi:hypothetical protein